MASFADGCGDSNADEVKVNEQNNVKSEDALLEHSKTSQVETPEKKGRGRGRGTKRKSEADMIAEAKAVFGDLNQTEGRQLRKRAEPPKVEKKATPARKGTSRKPAAQNNQPEKLNTSENDDKTQDDPIDEEVAAETKNEPDKEQNGADASLRNGTSATEGVASKLESHEESDSKPTDTASVENSEHSKVASE